jgi:hypothetical protein
MVIKLARIANFTTNTPKIIDKSGIKIDFKKGMSKHDKIMAGVNIWCSYYRANPHRFVKDYLGITLKMFQVTLLNRMNVEDYFMYIASRGRQKTGCLV